MLRYFLSAVPLMFAAIGALASTVTWTINNSTYSDGAAVSGSFDWDTATNSVLAWDLDVTASSDPFFPAVRYSDTLLDHDAKTIQVASGLRYVQFQTEDTGIYPGASRPRFLRFAVSYVGFDILDIPVANLALIDDTGEETSWVPGSFMECGACSPFRVGNGAAFLSAFGPVDPKPAPVPLPASLPLLAGALFAGGLYARRKAA